MSSQVLKVHKEVEVLYHCFYPSFRNFPKAEKNGLCLLNYSLFLTEKDTSFMFTTTLTPFSLLIGLLVAHVIGDYLLQNDFIAKAKNHTHEIGKDMYLAILPSHALIHGALVYLVAGSLIALVIEFVSHTLIDYLKCDGRISFYQDQLAHVGVKVIIVLYCWIFVLV